MDNVGNTESLGPVPILGEKFDSAQKKEPRDRWDRKTNFGCNSCMMYVPKGISEGRCRRNAPTMKGYPVVFSCDWCGEHKRGSNPIRDNG